MSEDKWISKLTSFKFKSEEELGKIELETLGTFYNYFDDEVLTEQKAAFEKHLESISILTDENKQKIRQVVSSVAKPLLNGSIPVSGSLTISELKSLSLPELHAILPNDHDRQIVGRLFLWWENQ